MAAARSVLIGGLMGYAFGSLGTGQERVNAQSALLLLLGLSAIWLGCNAASNDIVGELATFRRENDVNLSTATFVGAKYLVSSAFTVLRLALVYVLVAALAEGIPGDPLRQFMLLTLGALAGTARGRSGRFFGDDLRRRPANDALANRRGGRGCGRRAIRSCWRNGLQDHRSIGGKQACGGRATAPVSASATPLEHDKNGTPDGPWSPAETRTGRPGPAHAVPGNSCLRCSRDSRLAGPHHRRGRRIRFRGLDVSTDCRPARPGPALRRAL
jgi:hypothetical protein